MCKRAVCYALNCISLLQTQVLRQQDEKNGTTKEVIAAEEDDYGDVQDDREIDTDAHGFLLDKIDAILYTIESIANRSFASL